MRRLVGALSRRARVLAGTVLASLAAWGTPAAAQVAPVVQGADGYGPSRGIFVPWRSVAGEADGTALELNPGQLAQLGGSSLVLIGNQVTMDELLPGRGVGLLLGARLWSQSYAGIGLQSVGGTSAPLAGDRTKFQLGYAVRLGRSLGLGASWGHLFGSSYAGLDTFDLGASWRICPGLSLGEVVQDVGAPSGLRRAWTQELALRPLGGDRLEIAAAATHLEGRPWRAVAPRLRVLARIAEGLRPFVEVEGVPIGGASAFADTDNYRATAGLWIDFDHLGGGGAIRTVRRAGEGGDALGGSIFVRLTGDRFPSLVDARHVERVEVAKVRSDRQFLALAVRLRAMAANDAVAGVVVKVEDLELGVARIEELRDLIAALRARGKMVFAYSVYPSTREMYLASACDRIVLHPAGGVSLGGLSQDVTFYKEAMDHVGVAVDLVRIAEFKGAMEPFIVNRQSEPVRENKNRLLDDVFGRMVAAIAEGRQRAGGGAGALSPAKVREAIDRAAFTPRQAEDAGLIDAVRDENELGSYVGQAMGRRGIAIREPDPSPPHPESWPRRRLAVVLVDGTIADTSSQQLPFDLGEVAGADTLVKVLEQIRGDASIGAVVLRVNSPGGSAFASDVIARAVNRVRGVGKPVIVSMGDYAASGGYYVSAPGDAIFAQPSTITGSIGIFAFKVDLRKVMTSAGVSVETYRRGAHADLFSPYRPWTEDEKELIADKIRHLYDLFLATIEAGRKSRGITAARADQLGRGQVWTGAQGLGLGLVDHTGGLLAAIDHAAALARLRPTAAGLPEMVVLPRPRSNLLAQALGLGAAAAEAGRPATDEEEAPLAGGELLAAIATSPAARAAWRPLLRLLAPLLLSGGDGLQARLPFDIELR
ncbi:MAG TPA: signal peptide peptidase SppA [Polyangia bacterium]|nr:signal peptide peptidase SppA [Polyangia bacterium]